MIMLFVNQASALLYKYVMNKQEVERMQRSLIKLLHILCQQFAGISGFQRQPGLWFSKVQKYYFTLLLSVLNHKMQDLILLITGSESCKGMLGPMWLVPYSNKKVWLILIRFGYAFVCRCFLQRVNEYSSLCCNPPSQNKYCPFSGCPLLVQPRQTNMA